MDVDNAIRGRDDRLRSSPVIGTIKSESPGIPNAPSREFSDGPSGASNVDIDDDWPESEELILSPDPNAIDYDATESESQGSPRSEHSQDEAINHIDDQPQADEMSSRSQDNVGLTKPSDNAELRHIITTIDKRHCLKFRWYVARHLRSNFDSAHILTRQHYYMRIIKGHHFVESNNGDTKGVVLQRLRKTPLNRLDYEITRAHLDVCWMRLSLLPRHSSFS
ncbi:hypothetical protein F4818DRAFT_416742 [Hypoxylon cercidicola]|nr:hypothetical protein F4818DRAFT_416742 [Hypoxylon cercidicola]